MYKCEYRSWQFFKMNFYGVNRLQTPSKTVPVLLVLEARPFHSIHQLIPVSKTETRSCQMIVLYCMERMQLGMAAGYSINISNSSV